jgi:CRP-like cAMP-binding protein
MAASGGKVLTAIDFQVLANAGFPPARFQPGEVIFQEGDKSDRMFVVRTGEVAIERGGKVVETVPPGGIFGEMALIDGSPRAATARAKSACEVAPVTEKTFLFLVHETPVFALAVLRTLADRLRRQAERT